MFAILYKHMNILLYKLKMHTCAWCNREFVCEKKMDDAKYCYCIQLVGGSALIFYCSDECERDENAPTDDDTHS